MNIDVAEHTIPVLSILSKYYSLSFERQLDVDKYYSKKEMVSFRCAKREENSYYFAISFYGLCTGFDAHFYPSESLLLGWRLAYVKDKRLNKKNRALLKSVDSVFMQTKDFVIFLDKLIPLVPSTKGGPTASYNQLSRPLTEGPAVDTFLKMQSVGGLTISDESIEIEEK